jgi:hypothetical protein
MKKIFNKNGINKMSLMMIVAGLTLIASTYIR